MRPECAVLLTRNNKLWRFELFFNRSKAERAYRRALKESVLEAEDGGYHGTTAPTRAQIVHLPNFPRTKKEPWRQSYLNLATEELEELSVRLRLPVSIIQAVSQAERDTVEGKRYFENKYNEHAKALIRKYLPRVIVKQLLGPGFSMEEVVAPTRPAEHCVVVLLEKSNKPEEAINEALSIGGESEIAHDKDTIFIRFRLESEAAAKDLHARLSHLSQKYGSIVLLQHPLPPT